MEFIHKFLFYLVLANSLAFRCHGQFENPFMLAAMTGGGGGLGAGGFGMSLGATQMGMSPQEYAVLDNAVKTVVGSHASPDASLITFATQQGGVPRNMFQMLGYMPFFQNIARRSGIQPPITQPGQNLENILMQRAIQWMSSSGLAVTPLVYF